MSESVTTTVTREPAVPQDPSRTAYQNPEFMNASAPDAGAFCFWKHQRLRNINNYVSEVWGTGS